MFVVINNKYTTEIITNETEQKRALPFSCEYLLECHYHQSPWARLAICKQKEKGKLMAAFAIYVPSLWLLLGSLDWPWRCNSTLTCPGLTWHLLQFFLLVMEMEKWTFPSISKQPVICNVVCASVVSSLCFRTAQV